MFDFNEADELANGTRIYHTHMNGQFIGEVELDAYGDAFFSYVETAPPCISVDVEAAFEDFTSDMDFCIDDEHMEDDMSDAEADADTLASAGWGTDEDYGYYGGDEY